MFHTLSLIFLLVAMVLLAIMFNNSSDKIMRIIYGVVGVFTFMSFLNKIVFVSLGGFLMSIIWLAVAVELVKKTDFGNKGFEDLKREWNEFE